MGPRFFRNDADSEMRVGKAYRRDRENAWRGGLSCIGKSLPYS